MARTEVKDEAGNVIAVLDDNPEKKELTPDDMERAQNFERVEIKDDDSDTKTKDQSGVPGDEDDNDDDGDDEDRGTTGQDDRLTGDNDDGDDQGGDNAGGDDQSNLTERRREERKRRRASHREREERLRAELAVRDQAYAQLRAQVDQITQSNMSSQVAQIDQGLRRSAEIYQQQRARFQAATESADGATAVDALETMQKAQENFGKLKQMRESINVIAPQQGATDPRLIANAQKWMSDNKWYNPQGGDEDSEIVSTIDKRLIREGLDPTTSGYWDELSRRVGKYLPHRAKRDTMQGKGPNKGPKSPVQGSGRSGTNASGGGGFILSAARVQAIKDAGAWEDPKEREAMIKSFRDYDRQNKG